MAESLQLREWRKFKLCEINHVPVYAITKTTGKRVKRIARIIPDPICEYGPTLFQITPDKESPHKLPPLPCPPYCYMFQKYVQFSCYKDCSWILDLRKRSDLLKEIYANIDSSEEPEKEVQHVADGLISVYRVMRARNYNPCLEGWPVDETAVFSNLLRLVSHICDKYRVLDSCYMKFAVSEITLNSWRVHRWYEFLSIHESSERLKHSITYPHPPDKIPGIYGENWITDNHLKTFEYFLRCSSKLKFYAMCTIHFHKAKYLFRGKAEKEYMHFLQTPVKLRFLEIPVKFSGSHRYKYTLPMTLAIQKASSKALLLFLRYGALPISVFGGIHPPQKNMEEPLYYLCKMINQSIGEVCTEPCEHNECNHIRRQVDCLAIMLKSVAYLPVTFSDEFRDRDLTHLKINYFRSICVDRRVQKLIPDATGYKLPSLQKACRHQIRRILIEHPTVSIPDLIDKLPVPLIIKEYIDLKRY